MMNFRKNKDMVYQIQGKEREELATLQRQVVSLQSAFFGLADFIGRREGLDFNRVQFNSDRLAFVPIPQEPQTAK